ncbi:hypothetical protein N309_14065, partial [Tinamus guttatus]
EGPASVPVAPLLSPLLPWHWLSCSLLPPSPAPMTVCLEASSLVRQTRRFGVHRLEEATQGP